MIVRKELKQRAYDGKWELLGLYRDLSEPCHMYVDPDTGRRVYINDEKWITLNVYDVLMEEVND